MHFDQILVIKETRQHEKRVALTPQSVVLLVSKGYRVLVEENAGVNAGFKNADYIQAGAKIISFTKTGFPANSFIVRVLWGIKRRP
jgi:alanine dehydrogenase